MLKAPNDSAGADGGVVDLNFFAFLEEGFPQEEPNLFLKADLIDSSEGLITVILNRRVRSIVNNKKKKKYKLKEISYTPRTHRTYVGIIQSLLGHQLLQWLHFDIKHELKAQLILGK